MQSRVSCQYVLERPWDHVPIGTSPQVQALRLSEALHLTAADVDSHLMRVHVRCGKGRKDRFIPLPLVTLEALRRFWAAHRHPELIFPGGKPPEKV